MSCLDNTDILRIVGGNSFQIAITVKARRVSDGSEIEDFDLSASSPVLNMIHAGEKTRKYFVTQGNQAIISFDGSECLGYYGMEMSGSYNSEAWRFCIEKVLQLVDTNAKANIPEWSVLVDDTYFIEGTISIYGGGGGGDTVQADWTETNPTSAAFILHKPDLSVYATKAEVASGLAGKQDTIVDLTSIRYGAAAGATAYQKPASGIPESDMSESVKSALDKAEDAYQLPADGIPATDMSESVQSALAKANSAVQTETDPVFSNSPAADITQADINTWNAKQPAIADLSDIRAGAAAGATAVQPDEMAQAIDVVDGEIDDINAKIPATASNLNQLADKAYVNSSIATNSATYRGSFNLITDLGMNIDATHAQIAGALATAIVTADNNDYAFVQIPDSASTPTVIAKIERYKHNGSGWVYEYDLNNSGFTAAQWAAINSGITSGLVGKLSDLPNNSELATLLNGKQNVINDLSAIRSGASAGATAVQPSDLTDALNGVEEEIAGLDESKQDVIEDLSTIRSGAAAGATAYQKPVSGIPESDMSEGVQTSLGKADSAYQKPSSGIPATDMSDGVQASLDKANSAVQTETDPVFSNSPAAEISQNDINSWNAKQSAIADLADIREGAAAGATAVQPDEMAQAIDGVEGDIEDINAKIPTAASSLNQLADKAYVNSSIATNSATYRGSFNLITDLGMNVDATHAQIAGALATAIVTADNNDYAFVQIPDSASTPTVIAKIERYKHNGTGWVYEYDLNNSGFTAAQWAAINSGITSGLVGKLSDLPNNSELATLLNGKQNVINDLSAIRSGASAGATAYQKPSSGIPASDMSSTVQQELSKANTAVQTETDPIFSASPAAGITAQNIQTWNGEPAVRQAADTALQNSVSTLQTDLAAENSARQSADTALQTAIQNEVSARTTADALLQQQYNALTQSDIIVGALPASGVPNVIYRVPGTTDFTDYMWYNNQFVPMATYGLPISAEFVVDNNLNKTQEEVNEDMQSGLNQIDIKVNAINTYLDGGQIFRDVVIGSGGVITFNPITLSENGDSIEFCTIRESTEDLNVGDAFLTNSGVVAVTVRNNVIGVRNSQGTWMTNFNAGAGQAPVGYTYTGLRTYKLIVENNNLVLYQTYNGETTQKASSPISGHIIQFDTLCGSYSGSEWVGTLKKFVYTHNGVSKDVTMLRGFAVSGNVTINYDTQEGAKDKIAEIDTIKADIDALETAVEEVNAEVIQLGKRVIYLVGMGTDATEAGATTGDYYYNTYFGNIKHLISGGSETIALKEGAVYVMGGELFSCINGAFAKLNDVFGDWQFVTLQIGSIQVNDGAEVANDNRFRTGAIYGEHVFFLPTGYLFQQIVYYNISTGDFDSGFWVQKQYVHIDKSGCYARLTISRADYGVVTDSDLAAIRVPTRIDDLVKTINANYSTITEDIAVRDDIITEGWSRNNPVVTNTSRIRSAETTAWGSASGFNITRVKIPEFTKNVRIILKNNTVAPIGGYLAFYFSANDTGNADYLSGAGEQSVLVGEKANINDIIPIPATALYIFLCTDISASAGDTINNNNLQVYFEANAEESVAVAVERLIMPAITTGYLVDSDTGELIEASGYPYVDIDLTGKNYKTIRTYVTAFSSSRGYGFFFSDNSWVGVRPSASGDKTIEVPDGATKFRFCWNPGSISANRQYFFAGVANTPDEAYKKAKKNDIFFQFLPDFNLSNIPAVAIPQITSDLSDIYGRYDALLAAYPNYITKIDCSAADSVLGITRPAELSEMPIYLYKFSPVLTRIETFDVRPKAMIITGTHADEKLGIYTTWQMMKIICENWTTIHDAQILRTMADIYVMPLLNPWGFVNANNTVPGVPVPGRQNYNGVNLNRNFPTLNWTLTAVGTNYSGASAGSEYETKIAMYYIQQLKPDFFLDAHTGNMNIYGAMGAIELPNVQNLRAVAYCSARTATTQLMIEDSSFGTNPDQSLFDVGGFSATGELAAWVFENICDLAFLSEQCVESKWLNGVITNTIQSSYTDTIYRENLQATYNLLLRCLYAAAISK